MRLDRSLVGIALFAALAASCGSRTPASSGAAVGAAESVAMPSVAIAEPREAPDVLVLDATMTADEESQVTPIVPGRVVEVLVERGEHVEAGAPLVRLRDTDYRLQARTARASLEASAARLGIDPSGTPPAAEATPEVRSAAAELEAAEQALRRAEELATRGVFSPQQLDDARTRALRAREAHNVALNNARAAVATLETARSTLSSASTALRETTVTAPFAGEIAERSVSVGEYVALATPLVTLVRTDPLRAEVVIPQDQLSRVHVGLEISVHFDAYPDRSFAGTVRYVSASVRRESRGLTVEAVIPNADGALRPGMFGRVTIDLGTRRTLVAVPETAVLTEAGVSRVFVIAGGVVEERVVAISSRADGVILLETGLDPGLTVATERLTELSDGVHLTDAPPAAAAAAGSGAT